MFPRMPARQSRCRWGHRLDLQMALQCLYGAAAAKVSVHEPDSSSTPVLVNSPRISALTLCPWRLLLSTPYSFISETCSHTQHVDSTVTWQLAYRSRAESLEQFQALASVCKSGIGGGILSHVLSAGRPSSVTLGSH